MKFIVENWYIILACVAFVTVAIGLIYHFFKLPRASQIAKIKEWLLYAVAEAERELGSGTGQLKLRKVYDMFVTKFPFLVKFISFEYFSNIVDEVLVKFKKMFETNNNVKQYVDSSAVEHGDKI